MSISSAFRIFFAYSFFFCSEALFSILEISPPEAFPSRFRLWCYQLKKSKDDDSKPYVTPQNKVKTQTFKKGQFSVHVLGKDRKRKKPRCTQVKCTLTKTAW